MMTLFRAAPVGSSPRRMIAFALGLVLALMAGRALAAGSDEAPAPVLSPIEEVQAVIESQLIAFQNRDGAGAFFHAAPGIKGAFGDADTFMSMVERGYNVIYSNSGWTFGCRRRRRARAQGDLLPAHLRRTLADHGCAAHGLTRPRHSRQARLTH